MPSHLIIGSLQEAKKIANNLTRQKIIAGPDCYIDDLEEENLKISQVREIKHFLTRKPYQSNFMVVFLPEAHRLTIPAQNALLKTLEEPPEHAFVILTTPYEDRLLPTITSRCYMHYIKTEKSPLAKTNTFENITNQLKAKSVGEKITLSQEYTHPKTKSLSLCKEAIDFYRDKLYQSAQKKYADNAQLAQQTLDRIERNVDPRLSIEHLFLELLI